jgi:hypothetical protein
MLPNSVCSVCGSAFYRYPSQIARNVRVTCSRTCAARHFRDKGTTVSCECCNKPFYGRRSIAEKGFGRFCSHACELKARNRNGPVERTCLQCNTVFSKDHWSGPHGLFTTIPCISISRLAIGFSSWNWSRRLTTIPKGQGLRACDGRGDVIKGDVDEPTFVRNHWIRCRL